MALLEKFRSDMEGFNERDLRKRANTNLKLLSSLLRIAFYLFITFAVIFFFSGYVSSAERVPQIFYKFSIFVGIFNLVLSLFSIIYCVVETLKYHCRWIGFIFYTILRVLAIILIIYFQTLSYMISKGEVFNV